MTSCMMGLCEHVTGKGGRKKKIIRSGCVGFTDVEAGDNCGDSCAFV